MKIRMISTVATVAALVGMLSSPVAFSAEDGAEIAAGKKIAFDRKKGNCLSCHAIVNGQAAGNLGPPLIAMKARFPDKSVLRSQIYDATQRNPSTPMPPFGKHDILSDKEIDLVTEFIYSL